MAMSLSPAAQAQLTKQNAWLALRASGTHAMANAKLGFGDGWKLSAYQQNLFNQAGFVGLNAGQTISSDMASLLSNNFMDIA
jgi:hypothetical protein